MAKTSRIPHPTGETFVQIHAWAVRAVGRDAAAVLGHLDFLDRSHPVEGEILASRARLLADLEGLVSRYGVDKSLSELEEIGWIKRHEREVFGKRNLSIVHEFSLCPKTISDYLKTQNLDVLNSERRRSESGTDSRTDAGTDSRTDAGTSSIKEELEEEAAESSSSTLDSFFENLLRQQKSGDRERDAGVVQEARALIHIEKMDEAQALAAVSECKYPSQLIPALKHALSTKKQSDAEKLLEETKRRAIEAVQAKASQVPQIPRKAPALRTAAAVLGKRPEHTERP